MDAIKNIIVFATGLFVVGVNGQTFRTFQTGIQGDILVIDYGSLIFRGNHPTGPAVDSAEACSEVCMKVPGCTGYRFCGNRSGCSSGCKEYVAKNPPVSRAPSGNTISPDTPLPILGFGPNRGGRDGCQWSGLGANTGDQWAYGTCTLLKVKETENPEVDSQQPGGGWVSGTLALPSPCTSRTSGNACKICRASHDLKGCLDCTTSSSQLAVQVLLGDRPVQEACGYCYGDKAVRMKDKCRDCVLNQRPCQHCVLGADAKTEVDFCLSCVDQVGEDFLPWCVSCARSVSKDRLGLCQQCIERVKGVACSGGVAHRSGCVSTGEDSLCATCMQSTVPDRCVSCLTVGGAKFTPDCGGCAVVPRDKQGWCYDCVEGAASKESSCADCVSHSPYPGECITCNKDAATKAKSWCFGCTNWYNGDKELRQRCFQCLAGPGPSYFSQCSRLN